MTISADERAVDTDTVLRPFTIETPEADLEELRARVAATRWPERETVADQSQGPQLDSMQALRAIGRQNTTGANARRN